MSGAPSPYGRGGGRSGLGRGGLARGGGPALRHMPRPPVAGPVTVDRHEMIARWSDAARSLAGFTASEIRGEPVTRLLPPGVTRLLSPGVDVPGGGTESWTRVAW